MFGLYQSHLPLAAGAAQVVITGKPDFCHSFNRFEDGDRTSALWSYADPHDASAAGERLEQIAELGISTGNSRRLSRMWRWIPPSSLVHSLRLCRGLHQRSWQRPAGSEFLLMEHCASTRTVKRVPPFKSE